MTHAEEEDRNFLRPPFEEGLFFCLSVLLFLRRRLVEEPPDTLEDDLDRLGDRELNDFFREADETGETGTGISSNRSEPSSDTDNS